MPLYPPASSGGGTPGGSDTQVQYNDGGTFGGDANLTWDKTSGYLTVGIQSIVGSAVAGTDEAGHDLVLTATSANGTGNLAGGSLIINAGSSEGRSNGGGFIASAGTAHGSGQGGGLTFYAGDGADGSGGDINFHAGNSSNNFGGSITLQAGGGTNNYGGSIFINCADADGTDQDGGRIELYPGVATGSGVPGYIIMFNIPTADPHVEGAIYSGVAGALFISAG